MINVINCMAVKKCIFRLAHLIFCVGFLFFVLPEAVSAATYYVDNTIVDCADYAPTTFACGSGSFQGYNSMDDIEISVSAGINTIYFRRGQTHTGTGDFEAKAGHTYDALGAGDKPILSFDVTMALDIRTNDVGAVFNNLDVRTSVGYAARVYGEGAYTLNMTDVDLTGASRGLVLSGLTALVVTLNMSGVNIDGGNSDAFKIDDGDVTITGVIDNSSFICSAGYPFHLYSGTISNLTISNSSIHDSSSFGAHFRSDINGLYLTNVDMYNNIGSAVSFVPIPGVTQQNIVISGGSYYDNGDISSGANGIRLHPLAGSTFTDITISGVDIYNNTNDGINTYGVVDNLIIENSEIYENGIDGIDGHGDGVAFHESATAIVKNNYIHDNLKFQIHSIDDSVITAYNNIIEANDDIVGRYLMWLSGDAVLNLYNNTVVLNKESPTTDLLFIDISVTETQGIKNNIFVGGRYAINNASAESTTLNIDYNDYYNQFTAPLNNASAGAGSITTNPVFTNIATSNFTLQSTSSAIDAGVDLGSSYDHALVPGSTWSDSVTTADQDLRGSGWEIGAYIYPVPQAPTIDTPSAQSSTSIRWNFTDNADDETGFRLYDSTDTLVSSSAIADLTFLDETGLTEYTQYMGRYAIAYNGYGNSAPSAIASSIYTLASFTATTRGGHRGSIESMRNRIEMAGNMIRERFALQPSVTNQTHAVAPEQQYETWQQERICSRVMKWFRGVDKMLERINRRLDKRFKWTCQ